MGALLIRILIVAGIGYLIYLILRPSRAPRSEFKCESCQHCGRLYDDGVICRFEDKETFKNPIHIENCPDYSPRDRRT